MTYTLTYDGTDYKLADADADRLTKLYKKQTMALGPQFFTFNPDGTSGTVSIALSAGVPLALSTGSD
jgi:hypothetical protein